jgi:mannose-6-phosphate isomerase
MTQLNFTQPLVFEPIFKERIWGGRRLETEYGKKLPPAVLIGESWEIVDREEAQSVVHDGPLRGQTLHELWVNHRATIFGDVPDSPRFPLLVKLLDAQEKLSLQVHPPAGIAESLGGEPKTEFWYIAAAKPDADLFVGLREASSRDDFEGALHSGEAADHVHRIPVTAGDAMFLPSGRLHAIGAGNLIVEIQQNSDTTYRVFDWNRVDNIGKPRDLHIGESLQSIDFEDREPPLTEAKGETLVAHELFAVEKWELSATREIAPYGAFAIVFCLSGAIECSGVRCVPGEFVLVPALLTDRTVRPAAEGTALLRTTIPQR